FHLLQLEFLRGRLVDALPAPDDRWDDEQEQHQDADADGHVPRGEVLRPGAGGPVRRTRRGHGGRTARAVGVGGLRGTRRGPARLRGQDRPVGVARAGGSGRDLQALVAGGAVPLRAGLVGGGLERLLAVGAVVLDRRPRRRRALVAGQQRLV